ncbi:unnamed protein product [Brassica rapa]|uniref:Uncharacterized protein n=1 Tax=Brassica campestris TaxID=3711 RepID=A0A8D9G2E1_BRACM|nr:unnamed protein product [Brassica rapa]
MEHLSSIANDVVLRAGLSQVLKGVFRKIQELGSTIDEIVEEFDHVNGSLPKVLTRGSL